MNEENKKLRDIIKDIVFFCVLIITAAVCIFIKYTSEKEQTEMQKTPEQVVVGFHIKGEVLNPGYYELEYGCRVKDAILAAGGETENADTDAVNLAEKLTDGQELVIPPVKTQTAETEQVKSDNGKININTADKNELTSLYGIGNALAEQIISYRETNGKFKNISDLKKISGIGTAKFDKIKDKITV